MAKEKKTESKELERATVVAEPVEPDQTPEPEPITDGKYTMLCNLEHDNVRYEKGKTYLLDAETASLFLSKIWAK